MTVLLISSQIEDCFLHLQQIQFVRLSTVKLMKICLSDKKIMSKLLVKTNMEVLFWKK